MMSSVFPGSGVERIEQGEFVLPFFAHRVFGRSTAFQARAADLEKLSSADVMSLVIVIHSILDDLLSSLDPFALEKVVGREGMAAEMVALRDSWREAYPKLFEPYLDAVSEFVRETGGNPRYALLFRESQRAHSIEEKINQLRGRAIRHFGHVFTEREQFDGPKLFELAARLSVLLTEAGAAINQAALTAEDPVSRKVMADLRTHGIVDFVSSARTGTVDYRPVTRQIKRWIEARFRETVIEIPQKAQVAFMDAFRGVAYMYDSLLNDPTSPAVRAGHGLLTASTGDREAWARERSVGARDSMQALQATLMEQFPGQFIDALTGLKNKDYFLNELPRHIKGLRARGTPLVFLMIDIDHFKWVNDALGHPRGDEVLKATGGNDPGQRTGRRPRGPLRRGRAPRRRAVGSAHRHHPGREASIRPGKPGPCTGSDAGRPQGRVGRRPALRHALHRRCRGRRASRKSRRRSKRWTGRSMRRSTAGTRWSSSTLTREKRGWRT